MKVLHLLAVNKLTMSVMGNPLVLFIQGLRDKVIWDENEISYLSFAYFSKPIFNIFIAFFRSVSFKT